MRSTPSNEPLTGLLHSNDGVLRDAHELKRVDGFWRIAHGCGRGPCHRLERTPHPSAITTAYTAGPNELPSASTTCGTHHSHNICGACCLTMLACPSSLGLERGLGLEVCLGARHCIFPLLGRCAPAGKDHGLSKFGRPPSRAMVLRPHRGREMCPARTVYTLILQRL